MIKQSLIEIGYIIVVISILFSICVENHTFQDEFTTLALTSVIVVFVYAINKNSEYNSLKTDKDNQETILRKHYTNLMNKQNNYFEGMNEFYKGFIRYKENLIQVFSHCAELFADLKTVEFEISQQYLTQKKRPAIKEAKRIAELKKETKEYINHYKTMKYEYDALFDLFPELEDYIEKYIGQAETIEDVKENYDYAREWLSKDEYEKLTENERNQLALQRYIDSHKKTKWQIGRDYELLVMQHYQNLGYKVENLGMTKFNDMGRDLICKNGIQTLIVQCKNWSKEKTIHEKHICQIYGTTQVYNFENDLLIPALPVFVTTTELSARALKFANYLGVEILSFPFVEFPRIKCNINGNSKIYHLPFDQQYDKTKIENNGEFYAWTVEDAVKNGFVRAKKYFYI